ncbi:hypothetical protein LMG28688_04359 [Paraburkholderia caffeinitolerans]|uniref:Uncharacterized protein n=2 Tax=Paraburkholderia caffeinitolerans TaxID=1723730 RepID=A0A6J5GCZ4_9BURK|nr:hypothetical protein LMG28688_04359 [Paraburkholderia caffeinitolerans]
MAKPNPPEDRSIDKPASGEHAFESGDTPPPTTTGAGFTVALSVVFYLIVLATGIGYDHAHRLRSPRSDPPDTSTANWLARVRAPSFPLMPFKAISSVRVLLDQAHDCAQASQWDCVNAATHTALALRGNALEMPPRAPPVAQTLLAQSSANEVWVSSRTTVARPAGIGHAGSLRVADQVSAPYERGRNYRRIGTSFKTRKAIARRASTEFLADLYRH